MAEKPEKVNTSRRKFLEGAAGIAAIGAGAYATLKYDKILDLVRDDNGAFEKDPATLKAKEFLSREYGITILAGPNWDASLNGNRVSQKEYIQSLVAVLTAAGKYPPVLLKSKSIHMHIVNDLQRVNFSGKSWEEFWNRTSAGATAKAFGDILLDAKRLQRNKKVIDHELYHVLEYFERGLSASDPEWFHMHQEMCQCNPYGKDVAPKNELERSMYFAAFSPYGRTQPVEDRAEWAQEIMDPSKHANHQQVLRLTDQQFSEWLTRKGFPTTIENAVKVRTLIIKKRKAVLDDYEKWSNGAMNEAYWEKLRTGHIHPSSEITELLRGLTASVRKIEASESEKSPRT